MTGKDPHDAKNHQPKRPLGAGTGKIAQGPYYDGRLKFVGDGRRLVELSKAPVKSDRGTPYPCYTKNLESYQRRPKRTQKTPMSNEVATSKLVNFLNQDIERGTKEYGALRRLAYGMQLKAWGPDLSVKAFDDLDLVFFRGVLATRTQIHYMTEEEILRELGPNVYIFGCCVPLGFGRCRIILNSSRIFLDQQNPFAQMWNTILHEMVHGYLDVLCDTTKPTDYDYKMGPEWTEGHGQCFRRIIIAVDKRLQKYFKLRAIASWEPYKLEECGNSKVHHLGH